MRRVLPAFAAGLLFLFFIAFLILPLATVVREGCDPAVALETLRNPVHLRGLWNSVLIALVTTAFTYAAAFPLALLYDKWDFPGKGICSALALAPMILPPFVGALGFQQLLGHCGAFNAALRACGIEPIDWLGGDGRFLSICIVQALHLYPIAYLNLVTALANIDPLLDEAARNAGANAWTRFFRITLPMARPGIFAGGSIVLIWSFTELGTPLMFGFNTVMPVQVFNGVMELGSNPSAYTLVLIALVVSCLLYLLGRLSMGRMQGAVMSKGASGARSIVLTGWKRFLPPTVFFAFTFVAILPHVALLLLASTRNWHGTILPEGWTWIHYRSALSDELVLPSVLNSLKYSACAVLIATLIGCASAFLIKRVRIRFGWLLDLLAMAPLMIPGIVMAVGFLGMSVRHRWARALFDPADPNPLILLSLAYAVRRIPYVLRAACSGLEQIPEEFELAARNAGASFFRTVRSVAFPLIAANLAVSALLAFSFSMLEVSDSLILAQKAEYFPITKAIYELSLYLGSGPTSAAAFGAWSMLFLASTLASASILMGRKLGSLFKL